MLENQKSTGNDGVYLVFDFIPTAPERAEVYTKFQDVLKIAKNFCILVYVIRGRRLVNITNQVRERVNEDSNL